MIMGLEIAQRIRQAMNIHGFKQADLVERTGIGKASISNYLAGEYEPKQKNLYKIAHALNVNPAWLMGYDVPMSDVPAVSNILPVHRRKIPILGNVAAGEPIFADEEHEEYVIEDDANDCDFALRIAGDSMEPLLHDGDIVYVRQQDDVNDGEIGILLLDDEAVIKHIYHIPDGVQVVSQNAAKYPPKTYTWPNYDTIRILGRAIAYRRNL